MARCPQCHRDVGGVRFCPYDGTPLAHVGRVGPARELVVGDVVDGRYAIEEELGRGASGTVYRGRALALDAPVALKVLHPELAARHRSVSRFAREARASSRVDHPNVVRVYDFGFAEHGYYFLVMELLDGRSVAELMEDGDAHPSRAIRWLDQVARGVARAHALGVIHRDLKPANVVVTRGDGDHVTVVDFGLSKHVGGLEALRLTQAGTLVGTPEYMPPEQWMGGEVDARVDVYAFGVMAYELLTGRLPFDGATLVVLMQQHLNERPPPIMVTLPSGLAPLIERCLEKAADDRPRDMGEVAETLGRILEELDAVEPNPLPAAPMTELVLADLGALRAADLVEEIDRLRRVRARRLTEVAASLGDRRAAWDAHVDAIAQLERDAELRARERALRQVELEERRGARAAEEARRRHALVEASLRVAVHREGLDAAALDDDPVAAPDPQTAHRELHRADAELARFLSTSDPELMARWDAADAARRACDAADEVLQDAYDRLEEALRSDPEGRELVSQLTAVDGAIVAYRAQLRRARERAYQ